MHLRLIYTSTAHPCIYSLSLHDALPISLDARAPCRANDQPGPFSPFICSIVRFANRCAEGRPPTTQEPRSEEQTSELQSHSDFVSRLLLEKKNYDTARP